MDLKISQCKHHGGENLLCGFHFQGMQVIPLNTRQGIKRKLGNMTWDLEEERNAFTWKAA